MPKYNEKPAGVAVGSKILLIANPSTGFLEKITLEDLKTYFSAGAGTPTLAAPTGAVATSISSTQINTSCNAVANATGYVCERSANGTSGWAAVYTGASPSFNNTGLTASTQYFYRWKATAAGYNDSPYSSTVNATTGAAGASILPALIIAGPAANQVAIFYKNKINFIGGNLIGRFTISGGNSVAGVEAGDYVNVVRLNCSGNVSIGDTITFTPNGTDYLEHPTGDDLSAYTAQAIVATPGNMQPYIPAACIGGFSSGAAVELTFNKTPITVDSISGFSFTRNGSPWAASSASYNSGTGKVDFIMATAAAAGETLQVSFNGNGTVRDSGNVVVATFTNLSISNGN